MWNNDIRLVGNIGSITINRNRTRANLSLATNARRKDKTSGEWTTHTEWHEVVAFDLDRLGIGSRVQKGAFVHVTGTLQYRSYEKNGVTVKRAEVIADSIHPLRKSPSGDPEQEAPAVEADDEPEGPRVEGAETVATQA